MELKLKEFPKTGRSMYIFYPDGEPRTAFENTFITVVRESADKASVEKLLFEEGFADMANAQRMVIGFPNPTSAGWNYTLDAEKQDDLGDLLAMQDFLCNFTGKGENFNGGFHPMNYARYFVGVGDGASMVNTLAALHPQNIAGVMNIGGVFCAAAIKGSVGAVMPALLINAGIDSEGYYSTVCSATLKTCDDRSKLYTCDINPVQFVAIEAIPGATLTAELMKKGWYTLFSKVRRPNTSEYGDIDPRLVKDDYQFVIHLDDPCLGDNNGLPHTWFEYVPSSYKKDPSKKVPLMIFGHGGSDNPAEAAQMSRMHEVAEREGFIVAYPWSGEKWGWNINMDDNMPNDVEFIYALIAYLKKTYNIDETRVYTSGFSNGSAMTQVFTMCHPEIVAAICPNDTRWIMQRDARPFELSVLKKEQYDYIMPVWYTYGGRDVEFPVFRGHGQQMQYDFWKRYNHIPIKMTPYADEADPSGVGVPGDVQEVVHPCKEHPEQTYTIHRFFTKGENPKNYYNYILHHTKGHDCAPADAQMGWDFVKQYRRNADGSLGLVD